MTTHLVFTNQQMNGREIMTDIPRRQDPLFLLDPGLFLCHVPEELPQFPGLDQVVVSVRRKLHQLNVSSF